MVDSLYYTENYFKDHIKSKNIQNVSNLTIISINIANLFSKLRFFKVFLNNITTSENQPDIIVVTETHISESTNTGYSKEELRQIIPGYNFYHVGRETKKGGGVGVFVSQKLECETKVLEIARFREEQFENVVIKLPNIIKTGKFNTNKSIIIAAIYRQPNRELRSIHE